VASTPQLVALVVRGGTVLYGDPALVDVLRPNCDHLTVAGVQTFARQRNLYPLAFRGTPRNEPPCEPATH
jgi:hypothetical protein